MSVKQRVATLAIGLIILSLLLTACGGKPAMAEAATTSPAVITTQSPEPSTSPTTPQTEPPPLTAELTTPATEPATQAEATTSVAVAEPTSAAPEQVSEITMCTLSISCATILDNLSSLGEEKLNLVPTDGWILAPVEVTFEPGESVFDVLLRETRQRKIHVEFVSTPMYGNAYIEGIGNLYEFDCGELSGWTYSVDSEFPGYGCSQYLLANGDSIQWLYTCNLGRDVGAPQGE